MATMDRRDALWALASAPLAAAAITWTETDIEAASQAAAQARQTALQAKAPYKPNPQPPAGDDAFPE